MVRSQKKNMLDTEIRKKIGRGRSGGRSARKSQRSSEKQIKVVKPGMAGGTYKPLTENDLEKIHHAALEILSTIGIADPTPEVIEIAVDSGCFFNDNGRLCIPSSLIEDVLAKAASEYVVHSRNSVHSDLNVGGYRVHYATSGEAVSILEGLS